MSAAIVALAIAVTLEVAAVEAPDPPPPATPDARCICVEARTKNLWCGQCEMGHVAGLEVPSRKFFEALDAHGHEIQPARIRCESCQKCLENDGYCPRCQFGFVEKQLYFSALTWSLHRGEIISEPPECRGCRAHLGGAGWCESCDRGVVGNVSIAERDIYRIAVREQRVLRACLKTLPTCDHCAIARFMGSSCDRHPKSWRCLCATDGNRWCARCEVGSVAGIAIRARALYDATVERLPEGAADERGACESCRPGHWCDTCGTGRLGGGLVYARKPEFDRACATIEKLKRATSDPARCLSCALGEVTGKSCPTCAGPPPVQKEP